MKWGILVKCFGFAFITFFFLQGCCKPNKDPRGELPYECVEDIMAAEVISATVLPTMKASQGAVSYKNETTDWVDTLGGDLNFENSWVKLGVSTDKSLTACGSDLNKLSIGEEAWIENSNIHGLSRIRGPAYIYGSKISDEFFVGKQLMTVNSTYQEDVFVSGDVEAERCCFAKDIHSCASIITLKNSKTGSLFIYPSKSCPNLFVVRLEKGSFVDGDIYFKSCRGKVIIDPSSNVSGHIYGDFAMDCCPQWCVP